MRLERKKQILETNTNKHSVKKSHPVIFLSFDHRVNRWMHSGLENSQKKYNNNEKKKMAGPVKVIKKN